MLPGWSPERESSPLMWCGGGLYEMWLWAFCCLLCLDSISAVLIGTLLRLPQGLAKRKLSSQPCAHASFSGRLFWCYLVITSCGCSLSLYQLIDFSTGWKLQSPINSASSSGLLCASFFFWKFLNLVKKRQHGQVSPGTSFHFQVSWMDVQHTAGSKANSCVHFIVGTGTAAGLHK